MQRLRSSRAVTMVELILAMTIGALVLASVSAAFHSGLLIDGRLKQQGGIDQEIYWSLDRLSRDLENAVFYDFSGSYPDQLAFRGEQAQVTLLIPTDDGLKAVRYFLEEEQKGKVTQTLIKHRKHKAGESFTIGDISEDRAVSLVREVISFAAFLAGEQGEKKEDNDGREILSRHAKAGGLRFSFQAKKDGASLSKDWVDEWNTAVLPRKVRFEIKFIHEGMKDKSYEITRDILLPAA